MEAALIRRVKERAHFCCEYCGLLERYSSLPFEIDHVVAEQHGGKTLAGNLALACFADNHRKGPNLARLAPKTGKKTWLFNPPRQNQERQSRWNQPLHRGRTAAGTA